MATTSIKHTPEQIIQNPTGFNRWLIENGTLKLLREYENRGVNPPQDDYFLCDLVGGELWLCQTTIKSHTTPDGSRETNCKGIVQISDDCRRDYGDCYNGCYYLNRKNGQ